jgi:hypothetical protein
MHDEKPSISEENLRRDLLEIASAVIAAQAKNLFTAADAELVNTHTCVNLMLSELVVESLTARYGFDGIVAVKIPSAVFRLFRLLNENSIALDATLVCREKLRPMLAKL